MDKFLSIPVNKILESEIVEKKSRFLAFAKYVSSSEDAEMFYREMRKKYNDARHIVFGYRLLNVSRANDDKEPSGTAGKPILDVITKMNLYNVIVVVVRYFGGVKLGAGPLLRAYSNSASEVLKPPFCEFQQALKVKTEVGFSEFENLLKLATKNEIFLTDIEFSQKVSLTVIYPKDKEFNFEKLSEESIYYSFNEVM